MPFTKKIRKRIKGHSALDCPSLDEYSRDPWPCPKCVRTKRRDMGQLKPGSSVIFEG